MGDNLPTADKPAKKPRNTNYCCVPQCAQYSEPGISLHLFPKNDTLKAKWEALLKMGKLASATMRVCSRHFLPADYFRSGKQRHKLFPTAEPSQNLPHRRHDTVETPAKQQQKKARKERAALRGEKTSTDRNADKEKDVHEVGLPPPQPEIQEHGPVCIEFSVQVSLADFRSSRPSDSSRGLADVLSDLSLSEKCTQVNHLPLWEGEKPSAVKKDLTLSDLLTTNEYLFTYTGIHSMDLLETIVSCVQDLDADSPRNKKILSLRDRVILCMVKIKQNMSFAAIAVLFGINRQTCSNYFRNVCPMIARVLKVVIPWPDQEMIRSNLPVSFKNYKDTRIILDCAETEIEKCKCLKCRILTYSQYKKKHTAKFDVGITLSGLVTEISVPFGGRASDKRIVNESKVLDRLDYRDGVMTDKGFNIEKECLERNLNLIRPPFLSRQQQMSREDALKNAEIARARVHVERVIQRLRLYEFPCGPIPWSLAPYFDDALTIAGALTNLGPPVMNIDKFM